MNRLAAYNALNNSFSKKYIFNFGSEGGFYSEFNNMVLGMIYCLKYKYRFILYSGNSQFKTDKGWEDLFEPFCDTVNSSFHKQLNKRTTTPKLKVKHYLKWVLFKLFNKNTFLTYQLFNKFFNKDFEKEEFDFPEIGVKGNLREVAREIVEMIYNFNDATKSEVKATVAGLNLPAKYASVNIRRGDKDTEFNFVSTNDYIRKLKDLTNLNDVFVLTDDYTVIEELQKEYPGINFFTLTNEDERGYVHADFVKQSALKKKRELIKLFASLEVMKTSEFTIGTFTTNPGMFLGMAMPEEKFISVQKSSWYQFEQDDVKSHIAR